MGTGGLTDTVINPAVLLRFIGTLHAHLPTPFGHPPPLAFGNHLGGPHHFPRCPESPLERSCEATAEDGDPLRVVKAVQIWNGAWDEAAKHAADLGLPPPDERAILEKLRPVYASPTVANRSRLRLPPRHACLRGSAPWMRLLRDAASRRAQTAHETAEAYVARKGRVPLVSYPSGMLYGLSHAALERLVHVQRSPTTSSPDVHHDRDINHHAVPPVDNCIARVATEVTCVDYVRSRFGGTWPGPSTLCEDVSFGLCLHLHDVPFVQCDCMSDVTSAFRTNWLFERCARPVSVHPVKDGPEYLKFWRKLSQRA